MESRGRADRDRGNPRQQRRIGEADEFIVGRHARHGDRTLGKLCNTVAADVIGRNHSLTSSHQHSQADVVALRTLGSSTRPSRTSTLCETPRIATASAASAPARLAASTSRCANSLSAD